MLVTTVPQHQSNGAYLENYRCNAGNYAQSRARKPANAAHFPSARDSGDDARRIGANINEQKAPPTGNVRWLKVHVKTLFNGVRPIDWPCSRRESLPPR